MVSPMSRQRLGVNRSRWLLGKRITPGTDIGAEGHRMTLFASPPRSERHGLRVAVRAASPKASRQITDPYPAAGASLP